MSDNERREKNQRRRRRRPKKKRTGLIILTVVITILLLGGVGAGTYIYSILGSMDHETIDDSKENLNISDAASDKAKETGVVNIALFGVDSRDVNNDDGSRSDSIMIISVDSKTKKIKLSSIARDTKVNIPGKGMDKITHAYHFGGVELALKTINENFDLAITDYASINFVNLAKIIDAVGGVNIEVDSEELKYINQYIKEVNKEVGGSTSNITSAGTQKLTGAQAVAYCRIRATAGGDFKRTERQREVLSQMLNSMLSTSATKYPSLVKDLLPLIKTDMTSTEILKLGTKVVTSGTSTIDQKLFPGSDYSKGDTSTGIYYYETDLDKATTDMHNFIFNENN